MTSSSRFGLASLVFALWLTLVGLPAGVLAVDAAVRMHKGRPMVFVDGQPRPLPAYSPTSIPRLFPKQTQRFTQHELGMYFLNMPRGKADPTLPEWAPNPFWDGDTIGPGYVRELTSQSLDEQAAFILERQPEALFIVRFGPKEPRSWHRLHPEELVVNADGERLDTPSLASRLYNRDAARLIETVIRYCEDRPWSDHIIGYWTGHRVEGSHEAAIRGSVFDHSPVMVERWRQFLRRKYKQQHRLREAWADPSVRFDNAPIPANPFHAPQDEVSQRLFWGPRWADAPVRDYLELQAKLYREHTVTQAKAHHRATDRQRVFLLDTLKQGLQGWHNWGFFNPNVSRPQAYIGILAASGNLHGAALLNLDTYDGLITPHGYQARGLGGPYEPEGIVDSALLRGKAFFSEMDTRSYTGAAWSRFYRAKNDQEFAALTWRNLATSWARGFYSYWMDVYTDWFASEAMHKLIARQTRVIRESVDWPHHTPPGIAVVIDDQAVLQTNGNGRYAQEAIVWQIRQGIARCGVPYRVYLLEDLALDNFPDHRVFYFPNLFKVDDQRLAMLREHVFRDGRVVVWGPGSGITDGQTVSPEHAQRLTGFHFDMLRANHPRRMLVSDYTHPITRGMTQRVEGDSLAYGPVLRPKPQGPGQALAEGWGKQGKRFAALAVLPQGKGPAGTFDGPRNELGQGDWAGVFTTVVPLPASFWRGVSRYAGAHVYSEQNDVLIAGGPIVALHSVRSGEKTIRLPRPTKQVHDVIRGEVFAEDTDTLRFELEAPATRVFRLVE